MPGKNEEKEDDFFDMVMGMAEKIGLSGKDKQKYVHEHMTRGGYKMIPSYVRDGEQGEDDDDFFSGGRSRSSSRRTRGGNDENDSGSGWF